MSCLRAKVQEDRAEGTLRSSLRILRRSRDPALGVFPNLLFLGTSLNPMTAISTEQLAEDVDAAIRNAYGSVRLALHKLEDLKMNVIRQPDANPFGTAHDQMYEMFLELSRRLETMRAELRNRSQAEAQSRAQPGPPHPKPQPPSPVAGATPVANVGVRTGKPNRHNKIQPYVLVLVSFHPFSTVVMAEI